MGLIYPIHDNDQWTDVTTVMIFLVP